MTQRLKDALAALEALRPVLATARDKEILAAAWQKAWDEMIAAVNEWLSS